MKRANFKRAKLLRQKGALARLEAAFAKFKAANEDKFTKNGRWCVRTYAMECKRMSKEIAILKERLAIVA